MIYFRCAAEYYFQLLSSILKLAELCNVVLLEDEPIISQQGNILTVVVRLGDTILGADDIGHPETIPVIYRALTDDDFPLNNQLTAVVTKLRQHGCLISLDGECFEDIKNIPEAEGNEAAGEIPDEGHIVYVDFEKGKVGIRQRRKTYPIKLDETIVQQFYLRLADNLAEDLRNNFADEQLREEKSREILRILAETILATLDG